MKLGSRYREAAECIHSFSPSPSEDAQPSGPQHLISLCCPGSLRPAVPMGKGTMLFDRTSKGMHGHHMPRISNYTAV